MRFAIFLLYGIYGTLTLCIILAYVISDMAKNAPGFGTRLAREK